MKIIKISDSRRLNLSSIVVGYSQENKIEKIAFEIPDEYKEFGRKACFEGNGTKFAKTFDNVTGDTLTLTRDMTQFKELKMSIAFFKVENEDEIVARTSILNITIEDAIVCDDDIKPDDPKIVILDNLITRVTELDNQITQNENFRQANEKTREENEAIRQQNEAVRKENEQTWINNELLREKAENDRKNNELKRIANENKRVSDENARQEYINNLKTQVDNGDFDGADFNYKWDGTKLGVKNSKETTYQFVELKGDKGDKGDTGNGIQNIEKVSTLENVDTYAINYTDGTQTTFDVTNGEVTKEQLDEVDSKAKKTRDELERVKNDILETGTASDSFINVQDSAMAEMQELSIDGVCEQETTKGYNVLDLSKKPYNASASNLNGATVTENSGILTVDTTNATDNVVIRSKREMYTSQNSILLPKGSYYTNLFLNIVNLSGKSKGQLNRNFTLDEDCLMTQWFYNIAKGQKNVKLPLLISNNQTKTEYEPYTGGQPSPSPDYPQEIKTIENSLKITSCNKNIIPFNNLEQTTKNGVTYSVENGVLKLNGTATNGILIDLDNVKVPSGTYYFSSVVTGGEGSYGRYITTKDGTNLKTNSGEITLTENTELHFRFYINSGCIFRNAEVIGQLEKNTQGTEFEQHLETQIEANLPDGEFIGKLNDTGKDTLSVKYNEEDGKYHLNLYKNIGKNIFAGSDDENWITYSSLNSDTTTWFQNKRALPNSLNVLAISNNYLYSNNFTVSNIFNKDKSQGICYHTDRLLQIRINNNLLDTTSEKTRVNSFKTWLSTHNTEVYYVLATPYVVDLGVVDMPLSYNEITNLFTDSDLLPQINAKYYRNFITTIQNLQVNEKALKQELVDINARLSALESANASVTTESEVTE